MRRYNTALGIFEDDTILNIAFKFKSVDSPIINLDDNISKFKIKSENSPTIKIPNNNVIYSDCNNNAKNSSILFSIEQTKLNMDVVSRNLDYSNRMANQEGYCRPICEKFHLKELNNELNILYKQLK
jgi:hypothetical protein